MFHSFFTSLTKSKYLSIAFFYFHSVVSWNGKIHKTANSLFFCQLTLGLLARIRWEFYWSHSLRRIIIIIIINKVWKSDLTDKTKCSFFQAAVVSILLYGYTTWTLTKCMEKKLDSNYTRMLRAILKKSWRQHLTKQQLYDHLPFITKTIKVRQTRHVGHCCRTKDKLISNILLWTSSHGQAKAGQLARTYIQQFCADTGYSLEDLLGEMDNRDRWQERVWEIYAGSMTWWWWLDKNTHNIVFISLHLSFIELFLLCMNSSWWTLP